MIDHVILTVSDLDRSAAFYINALKPLGITKSTDFKGQDGHPDLKGIGNDNTVIFWLKQGTVNANGVHVGFKGKDKDEVNAFHGAAIDAGAESRAAPRIFPEYYPGYYAAWIIDPDGYEIEVVYKS